MKQFFIVTLICFLSAFSYAADLTLDGDTLTISDTLTYDNVAIINGGALIMETGGGALGALILTCDSLYIDASSSIIGTGSFPTSLILPAKIEIIVLDFLESPQCGHLKL